MCVWGKRVKEGPGLRVGAEAWERGEGGEGRSLWPLLGSEPAPTLSTLSQTGLPERLRPQVGQSRGRAAPGAAWRGPWHRRRGEAQEARDRELSWAERTALRGG